MRHAILKTIAYFDLFDFPLTAFEVWKWLRGPEPGNFAIVEAALDQAVRDGVLAGQHGFFFLPGRGEIVDTRHERYLIAERKYRRVRSAIRFLRLIPSIRSVAVANTLAWSHARDASDIDLFIVTRPGALWWSRLLAVTPFALLGLRPSHTRERDTFCFSFFATETALDFAPIAISPDDPYLLMWIASLVPVYDPDGLIEAVWDANPWVRAALPNAWATRPSMRRRVDGRAELRELRHAGVPRIGESLARAFQLMLLPPALRTVMNIDHRVFVTDELLKFHENDRRHEFRERYETRCRSLGV